MRKNEVSVFRVADNDDVNFPTKQIKMTTLDHQQITNSDQLDQLESGIFRPYTAETYDSIQMLSQVRLRRRCCSVSQGH
jgi:hypothetical protein